MSAGRVNYWGYAPVSFFAPHPAYSSRQGPLEPLNEFRDLVKALHRAGIEVILDVVFNHTAEGSESGPTLCFRGIANDALLFYIILNAHWEPLDFELPSVGKGGKHPWRRWIDTAQETPNDIVPWEEARTVPGLTYLAEARSVWYFMLAKVEDDPRIHLNCD